LVTRCFHVACPVKLHQFYNQAYPPQFLAGK
jgi:hypothetical protein